MHSRAWPISQNCEWLCLFCLHSTTATWLLLYFYHYCLTLLTTVQLCRCYTAATMLLNSLVCCYVLLRCCWQDVFLYVWQRHEWLISNNGHWFSHYRNNEYAYLCFGIPVKTQATVSLTRSSHLRWLSQSNKLGRMHAYMHEHAKIHKTKFCDSSSFLQRCLSVDYAAACFHDGRHLLGNSSFCKHIKNGRFQKDEEVPVHDSGDLWAEKWRTGLWPLWLRRLSAVW